jgi:hypothetical protein
MEGSGETDENGELRISLPVSVLERLGCGTATRC